MILHSHSSGRSAAPGSEHSSVECPVLVILHGLFGSHDNWAGQARRLGNHYHVISLDLRNHGRSPHASDMSYATMGQDVLDTLDALSVKRFALLGHSMGGKIALTLSQRAAHRVSRLIVVDIAPRQYTAHHSDVLAAMTSLDTHTLTSRTDADRRLAPTIKDATLRQFLLKNLTRAPDQTYRWRINLAAISAEYDQLLLPPPPQSTVNCPLLVVRGGASDYVQPSDLTLFLNWSKDPNWYTVEGAGHWPHATHPDETAAALTAFLLDY